MTNTKRLGRYHNPYFNNNNSTNNGNHNSSSQLHIDEAASLYNENGRKSLANWDKPLFRHKRTSLQKVIADAT